MVRQNRNLLLLFVALCLMSAAISYSDYVQKKGIDAELFKISEEVRIDRFVLQQGKDSVVLQAGSGVWKVNDRYAADVQRVRLFFAAMDRARPRRMVTGLLKDSLSTRLQSDGFKARFYENGQLIFSVLALGDEKNQITWFAKPENPEPVEMRIPGYRSNPISVFSIQENEWREKRVFPFNWRNFTGLNAKFPGSTNQDFSITVANGLLAIPGLDVPDTLRLKNYIDAVQLLEAESILDSRNGKDSLLQVKPDVVLTLSEVSGRIHELRLYPNGQALVDSTEMIRLGIPGQRILRTSRRMFVPVGSPGGQRIR